MKPLIVIVPFVLAVTEASRRSITDRPLQCDSLRVDLPLEWQTMTCSCVKKMKNQVQMQVNASVTYFAMGSYFLQAKVNRPGFSKFFLYSARKERQQAIKFVEYLLMRGEMTMKEDYYQLIGSPKPFAFEWENGLDALKKALAIATGLTKHIKDIIQTCEVNENSDKDFHLVGWLSGEILDEQYKSQQELAGKITELGRMLRQHGTVAEFLYDTSNPPEYLHSN